MAKETTETYEDAHEAGYFGEPADRRDDEIYTAAQEEERVEHWSADNDLPAEGENPPAPTPTSRKPATAKPAAARGDS